MKKLAIPVLNGQLSSHFGQTQYFYFYEIDNNTTLNQSMETSPEQDHSAIPAWLSEQNVTDIIIGGIGGPAAEKLSDFDINIFENGMSTSPNELSQMFINNQLSIFGDSCCGGHDHEHEHEHEHGHKNGGCGCHHN
jgi:predicted Fe-Mo cluster-binding NifX family protein